MLLRLNKRRGEVSAVDEIKKRPTEGQTPGTNILARIKEQIANGEPEDAVGWPVFVNLGS